MPTEPHRRSTALTVLMPQDAQQRLRQQRRGAVVTGLGELGRLSAPTLTEAVKTGALRYLLAAVEAGKIDMGTSDRAAELPAPTRIAFTLDAKAKQSIDGALQAFHALIAKHDLEVLHYEGYGKEYIKAFKASPDAWAQMVKQLAFHTMFNRPGVCYESAQPRKYQLGRTEVIRSASNESKAWAEAMLDPNQTVCKLLLNHS